MRKSWECGALEPTEPAEVIASRPAAGCGGGPYGKPPVIRVPRSILCWLVSLLVVALLAEAEAAGLVPGALPSVPGWRRTRLDKYQKSTGMSDIGAMNRMRICFVGKYPPIEGGVTAQT
jgi:hypothetical protein